MKKEYNKPNAVILSICSDRILMGSDSCPENGGQGTPGINAQAKNYSEEWQDEDF